jgi:hypothetical protein
MRIDEFVLRRFDDPDEVRQFPLGRFELVKVGRMTLGRATYEPGHLLGSEEYAAGKG